MNRLGQIRKFDVPEAWPNEAASFTPWLEEHIGEFGEVLDLDLDVASRKAPLGDSSLAVGTKRRPRWIRTSPSVSSAHWLTDANQRRARCFRASMSCNDQM